MAANLRRLPVPGILYGYGLQPRRGYAHDLGAKLMQMAESLISLVTVMAIVSRAIGLLGN